MQGRYKGTVAVSERREIPACGRQASTALGMTARGEEQAKAAGLPEEASGRKNRGRPALQGTIEAHATRGLDLARRLGWRRRSLR